ncbi:MAG: hypothetical protein JSV24_04520, partial [Bacteroidales bacterium]
NDSQRYIDWIYGVRGTNTITGTVVIGGGLGDAPVDDPFYFRAIPVPTPTETSETITIPATAQPGELFTVTLQIWNKCNDLFIPELPVEYDAVIEVIESPSASMGADFSICESDIPGTTITITASGGGIGTGFDYIIEGPNGNLSYFNQPSPFSPDISAELSVGNNKFKLISVQAVPGNGCILTGDIDSTIITVDQNVTPATTGPDDSVCATVYPDLGGNTPAVGVGAWTRIAGTATIDNPADPNTSVSNLSIGANTFRWEITNGTCSDFADITITREEDPTAAITGGDATICTTTYADLGGNTPAVGTGDWTVTSNLLWYETFDDLAEGTNNDGGATAWSITDGSPFNTDYAAVRVPIVAVPVMSKMFDANDTDGEVAWFSEVIVTGAKTDLGISVDLFETGAMEGDDYIRTYYKIDGGGETEFANITDDFGSTIATATGLAVTSDIQIVIRISNNANGESHYIDNVFVGEGFTGPFPVINDRTDPNSGVTGLLLGDNTFRWTIRNGDCPPSFAEITLTRDPEPTAEAGSDIDRCSATPLDPIAMTGATAGGTYSIVNWTGGGGLGNWIQNADPALATFTPTVSTGSFTATLTVTGSGGCVGTNPQDTRVISWGETPTANAGGDIDRCSATPTDPIPMNGASAGGTYSAVTWTGGGGMGSWTQNADPALATFTPSQPSGTFNATLTVSGSGACLGTDPQDTRTITWGETPTANAAGDIDRCSTTPTDPIAMTGATAGGTYGGVTWTGGGGLGSWTQNADPALATFTPSVSSGSFTATLTVTGSGACTGTDSQDTRTVSWGETPTADAGAAITRCSGTPLDPIAMTGASAGGTYSGVNWTGGGGLGSWTQDADPALATFTPSVASGSFTATLTITGSGTCTGTNPQDTRTVTWGETPTANAGGDIDRCSATPTDPIAMTGASAGGTYSGVNWTGGGGMGTWTQNADPALATFTPSVSSGSFTATLIVTGSVGCVGTNPQDTRTISWGETPTANAGGDVD